MSDISSDYPQNQTQCENFCQKTGVNYLVVIVLCFVEEEKITDSDWKNNGLQE